MGIGVWVGIRARGALAATFLLAVPESVRDLRAQREPCLSFFAAKDGADHCIPHFCSFHGSPCVPMLSWIPRVPRENLVFHISHGFPGILRSHGFHDFPWGFMDFMVSHGFHGAMGGGPTTAGLTKFVTGNCKHANSMENIQYGKSSNIADRLWHRLSMWRGG
eukprot:gene7436-biopygen6059